MKRAVELVYQQANLAYAQQLNTAEQTRYTEALVRKVVSETRLNQLDIDAAEKFNNMGREVKEWSPIIEIFKNVMRSTRR